jgi:YggT family protein
MSAIINYLVMLAFSVITLLLVVRLLMYGFRVDREAESTQLVAKLTNPFVAPLARLLPKFPQLDLAALLILLAVEFIKYIVIGILYTGSSLDILRLVILVPADIIMQICWLLFYIILFDVILSWVAPQLESPAVTFIRMMSVPPVRAARNIISAQSGFDFGPWVALIVLKVVQLAITAYIPAGYFF